MYGSYKKIENLQTDVVAGISGILLPNSLTISAFTQVFSGIFAVDTDTNGVPTLYCSKLVGSPLQLTMQRPDTTTYVVDAEPVAILLGSHPLIIQKPRIS